MHKSLFTGCRAALLLLAVTTCTALLAASAHGECSPSYFEAFAGDPAYCGCFGYYDDDNDTYSTSWRRLTNIYDQPEGDCTAANCLAADAGCADVASSATPLEDCDDDNADINPEADEICGDSLDNDCSGIADDGCNEAPVIAPASVSVTISEDCGLTAPTMSATDADGDTLTWSMSVEPSSGTASVSGTGEWPQSLSYNPDADYNGSDSFELAVSDGNGGSATITVNVTVNSINDPPVISGAATLSTNEDTGLIIVFANLTVTDVDNTYPTCFSLTVQTGTNYTVSGSTVTPSAGFSGTLTVPVKVNDGGLDSNIYNLSVTVNPVNDRPGFTASDPASADEDTGAQTIGGWASGFDPGATEEAGQSLVAYTVSSVSDTSLFSAGPLVDTSGNLTYTPAADANGISTFNVTVQDDGGTAYDGDDTSVAQTFTITVTAVNDQPSFIASVPTAVNEDDGAQTLNAWATIFDPGASNESSQTATYTVSNVTDASLFSAGPSVDSSGMLTYTPAADSNGTSDFDVTVRDSGGTSDGGSDTSGFQTFTITVDALNDAPVNTVAPTFSGNMVVGQILNKSSDGTWNDDADGGTSNITGYAYQWQRADDDSDTSLTDIIGETADTYTLTSADAGKYIRVKVTATDNGVPATASGDAFSAYRGVPEIMTDAETSVDTTSAQFNGTLGSMGETVSAIRFEYGTTTAYGSEISASPASVSAGTHTDTPISEIPLTLGAGMVYHYRIAATVDGTDIYGDDRTFAAATTEMSAPGNALSFSGTNHVTAPLAATATDNVTIEAWVNWAGGSGQTVIYNGTDGTDGCGIKITPAIAVECGGSESAVSSAQFTPGTWQHVAAVRGAGTWKLYLNGLERTLTGNPSSAAPTGTTSIGTGFSGRLDEVRIWNTARTPTQIQDNMIRSLTGTEGGLAAYYHCDHASGAILADRTSAHKDGALVNSPLWEDSAAFTAWTGNTDNDWNTGTNWTDGVPGAGSTAGISSGSPVLSSTGDCGNLIISSGATLNLSSGGSLSISGDAFNNGTLSAASDSTVTYPGTAEQYVMTGTYGNLTLNNADGFVAEGTLTAAGTLGLVSGSLTLNGTLTVSGGTLDFSDGDIDYNGHSPIVYSGSASLEYSGTGPYTTTDDEFPASSGPANLTLGSAGGITLHADRTLAGSLTLSSGEFSANDFSLNVGGDWTKTGGTFNAGTGTVTFNGGSAQTVQSGGGTFGHLTVSKTGGTLSLSDALDADGTLTITAGTLNAAGRNISVAGDWDSGGTFTAGSGTVTLDGDAQTVYGSTTFGNLSKNAAAADVLTFEAGTTQTITDTLTLQGADADSLLSLRSDSDGVQWQINPQGTRNLAWLDVMDSNNINDTKADTTADNCVSSGNNTNWNVLIPVAETQTVPGVEDNRSVVTLVGTDADDEPTLTFHITTLPVRGTLWQTADGSTPGAEITETDTEVTHSGHRVVYQPLPDDNGGGIGNFGFIVNDGDYDSPATSVTVNVAAVNDAPIITGQGSVSVPEDTPLTVAFSHLAVTDVDNSYPSDFTLTVYTGENYAPDEGNPLVILPSPDFNGDLSVPVRVHDGAAHSGYHHLSVTVGPVDDDPTAPGQIADVTVDEDAADTVITLGAVFGDIDSAAIAKSVASNSSPELLTATVDGDTLTLAYLPDQHGTAEIVIRGSADGKSAETAFSVTVIPVDDAPRVADGIADVTADEDAADTVITLADVFTDIDGDDSAIVKSVKSVGDPSLVAAAISGDTLTLGFLPDANGTAAVMIQGTADGKSAETSFAVTVRPVDDPPRPVGDEATKIKVSEGDADTVLNLDEIFTDIDSENHSLTFAASGSDPDFVTVSLDGSLLTLSFPRRDELGEAVVTITVTFEGKTVSYDFEVTVGPRTYAVSGQVGYFSSAIPLPGIEMILTGTSFYDGSPLDYTVETDENGIYIFPEAVRGDYMLTPFCDDPPDPVTLSATDASAIGMAVVGITDLTPDEEIAADVTRNGTISGMDASRLARFSTGLIPAMSDLGDVWKFFPGEIAFFAGADLENQDFAGAMPGDVTGSYSPGNRRHGRDPARMTEIAAAPGRTLSVPLVLTDETEIRGVDIRVAYDRDTLTPGEITLAGGILENGDYELAANPDADGDIAIATFSRSFPVTASGTLLTLSFDVTGGGDTLLDITDFRVNEAYVPEDAGGFDIGGTLSQRLRIDTGTAPYAPDTRDSAEYDLSGDGRIGTSSHCDWATWPRPSGCCDASRGFRFYLV